MKKLKRISAALMVILLGTFAWRRSLYRKYWIYIYIKRQIVLEWS